MFLLAYSQANSMSPSPVRKKVRLSEAQSKTNGIPKRFENFTRFFLVAFFKLKLFFKDVCRNQGNENILLLQGIPYITYI